MEAEDVSWMRPVWRTLVVGASPGEQMAIGDEFLFTGHLRRRLPDRVDTCGAIAPADLHNADADWVSASTHRDPLGIEWVFVLGDEDAGQWRLSEVTAGSPTPP